MNWLCVSVVTCVCLSCHAVFGQAPRDSVELADQIARSLGAAPTLSESGVERSVAIFAFSMEDGQVGSDIALQLKMLEERVRFSLRKYLPANVKVLTHKETVDNFTAAGVDPRVIDIDRPETTSLAVDRLGWYAVMSIKVEAENASQLKEMQIDGEPIKIVPKIVFSNGDYWEAEEGLVAEPRSIGQLTSSHQDRKKFALELRVSDELVSLRECVDQDSQYYGVYFAELTKEQSESNSIWLQLAVAKRESEEGGQTLNPASDSRLYPIEVNVNGRFILGVDAESTEITAGADVKVADEATLDGEAQTAKVACLTNGIGDRVTLPSGQQVLGGRFMKIRIEEQLGRTLHRYRRFAELSGVTVEPGVISVRIYSYLLAGDTRNVIVPPPPLAERSDAHNNRLHGYPIEEYRIMYATNGEFPVDSASLQSVPSATD